MKRHRRRSTTPGEHRPVMLDEVLEILDPQPGQIVLDCTVGWAGHAVELLRRVGPSGRLIGIDWDAENLPRVEERLKAVGYPFRLHHANFAGLEKVLAAEEVEQVDLLLADLGMSSMQVDDPERGFSYSRDGPLDMRMNRTRGKTAAEILATISETELARSLQEFGDEPEADLIARAIVAARAEHPLDRTRQLAELIQRATRQKNWRLHPAPGKWQTHPAARTFQALRILVNREPGNLENLLRVLPRILKRGGRAAIISFHSGEDRIVKSRLHQWLRSEEVQEIGSEPLRPSLKERLTNPRARSAKLRWLRR